VPLRPKNKLPPHRLIAYERAEAERQKCKEWLIRIMRASPTKTQSKDDLRAEAMRDLKVSKNSFDSAWTGAIVDTIARTLCLAARLFRFHNLHDQRR